MRQRFAMRLGSEFAQRRLRVLQCLALRPESGIAQSRPTVGKFCTLTKAPGWPAHARRAIARSPGIAAFARPGASAWCCRHILLHTRPVVTAYGHDRAWRGPWCWRSSLFTLHAGFELCGGIHRGRRWRSVLRLSFCAASTTA